MSKLLETWDVMPHGDLVEVEDGVLTVAGEIVMPLGRFPRRMTVVRLRGDRTAIFSAIALEPEGMKRIEAMGWPAFLVVPSGAHRLDARIWKQRYPALKVVAPRGACGLVEEAVPVDSTAGGFDDPDVTFVTVAGTREREAALMIRRSGGLTLVVNDVIANVAHPNGIGAQVMGRLFGFGVRTPQVPRIIRSRLVADPVALAEQFRDWAGHPHLRRIIVSHGDIIADEPARVLRDIAGRLDPR